MKDKQKITGLMTAAFIVFTAFSLLPAKAQEYVSISGGSITGIYYRAAKTLCALLKESPNHKYNCEGRTALGSVFNVNALNRKLIHFGFVQSDRNWQAWNGKAEWQDRPVTSVRSVLSLHDEVVHIVARAGKNIRTVADLKDKNVNIGNISSGQRGNARAILKVYGLDHKENFESFSYQQADTFANFSNGELDAFFYTVGIPSRFLGELFAKGNAILLPLESDKLKSLADQSPFYHETTIPAGTYQRVDAPVPAVGLKATLMTDATIPDQVVTDLLESLFSNFETFKASHPALADLTPQHMTEGLTAPLHSAAEKFFKDKGWLK